MKQVVGDADRGDNCPDTTRALHQGQVAKVFGNSVLLLNTYFEMGAQNRSQGYRLNLRYVLHLSGAP
jgi:hypothetical protein